MSREWASAINEPIFELGGTPISLGTLATMAAIVAATWCGSWLIRWLLRRALKNPEFQEGAAFRTLSAVLHYLMLVGGVLVAFQTAGVKLSALLAAGAALAVGAGFGLQNAVQNLVSGVILMMERSVRRGDVLEVQGHLIRVEDVRIRSTVGVSRDGEHLILPNSALVQTTIKNLSMAGDDSFRLRVQVGVAYSSDLKVVAEALDEAARAVPWRDPKRKPQVLLAGFGSSSVDFEVAVWTQSPWEIRIRQSELREQIWWALKRHNITIAFPQLDVHFDAESKVPGVPPFT